LSIKDLSSFGVPNFEDAAKKDETLADIYNYRVPFYEKWAQFTIDCSGANAEENMQKTVKALDLSEF
jgi:shikimate kinase